MTTGRAGRVLYLGASHAPLGRAVHEGRDGEAACTLLVPLAEELLLQLIGPPLVRARCCCQVPNVSTLQHHLHTHIMTLLVEHLRIAIIAFGQISAGPSDTCTAFCGHFHTSPVMQLHYYISMLLKCLRVATRPQVALACTDGVSELA